MKKILYTLFALSMFGAAYADVDFSQAIGSTSMPSDAQIRSIISQFNLTADEQEQVFKETKKKLQQMYANPDVMQSNDELNAALKALQTTDLSDYMDDSLKNQVLRDTSKIQGVNRGSVQKTSSSSSAQPQTATSTKKYTSHDPLTKSREKKSFSSQRSSY